MDIKTLVIIVVVLIIGIIIVYEVVNVMFGGFSLDDVPGGSDFTTQATLQPTPYPTPPPLANITPDVVPGKVKLSGTVYINGKPAKNYAEIEEFRFVPMTSNTQKYIVGFTEGVYEIYAFESPVTDRYSYEMKGSVNDNGGYEIMVSAGTPVYLGIEYVREAHFVNNDYTRHPDPDTIRMYYSKSNPFVINGSTRMDLNITLS